MEHQIATSNLEATHALISKWAKEASALKPHDGADLPDVLKRTEALCLMARNTDLGKTVLGFERFGGEFPLAGINKLVTSWEESINPTDEFPFRHYPASIKDKAIKRHESTMSNCIHELKTLVSTFTAAASKI